MDLPLKLPIDAMQTQWSALLNPVLDNPLLSGRLLTVSVVSGVTVINHGLSRNMIGWIIVDQTSPAGIYRSQPLNDKTLVLTSDASVTLTLWVF